MQQNASANDIKRNVTDPGEEDITDSRAGKCESEDSEETVHAGGGDSTK